VKERVAANCDAGRCDFAERQAHSPARDARTLAIVSPQTRMTRSDIGGGPRMCNSFAHVVLHTSEPLKRRQKIAAAGDIQSARQKLSGDLFMIVDPKMASR
jgi:hypothetical protein